jgi:hypothetical protein
LAKKGPILFISNHFFRLNPEQVFLINPLRSFRTNTKKKPRDFRSLGLFFFNPGNDLLSHSLTAAVSSALEGLTSVFGMGTGGTPPVRSPRIPLINITNELIIRDFIHLYEILRPCLSRTNVVKSHGRLVLVSFKPYSSSTPSLSNSSSTSGL